MSALPRICFIDREIASGKYPNTAQLAKKYETSVSTISRDIDFMKNMMNAPIEYDAPRRGYYYAEPHYQISTAFSGAEDLLALSMAKSILSLYRDTPIYGAACQLLDSITEPLAAGESSDWYASRIVVPRVPSVVIHPGTWAALTRSLKENRVITFDYCGVRDQDYRTRRARPYQLLFDSGVWFLYAFDEERKGIRLFSLLRMKNLVLTGDHFILPKDAGYSASTGGSYFGVFAGRKTRRFRIAFYAGSAVWIRERVWAEDQEIEEIDDGIIISFSSTQYDKVMEWVLSQGCMAKPLEPEEFVSYWKWNARKTWKTVREMV